MIIECYHSSCRYHHSHYGEEGPFCDENECRATEDEMRKYGEERKAYLKRVTISEEVMERFKERKSLAGDLQPGDGTRYEMTATKQDGIVEVMVTNLGVIDCLVFLDNQEECYKTARGLGVTNPWTIKAAKEMRDMLLERIAKDGL